MNENIIYWSVFTATCVLPFVILWAWYKIKMYREHKRFIKELDAKYEKWEKEWNEALKKALEPLVPVIVEMIKKNQQKN